MASLTHIPGTTGLPLIGDTIRFLKEPQELFNKKQQQYGNIFKYRMFGREYVCIMGASGNRFVLVEQTKHFSSKDGWVLINELFHGGLMLQDGDEHKQHRGILQAAFKKEALQHYVEAMNPVIQEFSKKMAQQTAVTVFPRIKELTLQLAGKVFFNLDFSNNLQHINHAIINMVQASITPFHINLPFTTYGKGMQGRKVLQAFFSTIIKERRQQPGNDMLSNLCLATNEAGNTLSDDEIIDHLIFFIMAAHDTTASSLTSIIYELAMHPGWQQQLREECSLVNNDTGSGGRTIHQNLDALEKTGWVIKETLRLHPPLILIPRKAQTDMQFENTHIPAGTNVTLLLYHNHNNANYWSDPEAFDPYRFSAEISEHKNARMRMRLGAGQHFCLGHVFADLQMKLVLFHLLKNYTWQLPANYQPVYTHIPIQHPKTGCVCILKPVDFEGG
ncbi:MAG: cytochrome P450 [Chitinophagaceae bacterium]|nr:cytochrome P450 [Chitinophagaceae bacterium]